MSENVIAIRASSSVEKFGRIGFIRIADDDGNMIQYGGIDANRSYDIKFDVERFGMYYSKFKVSILGLSSDTISRLTEWDEYAAYERHRAVEVYAGYYIETNGRKVPRVACIASGFILRSIATNPPERWLEMTCLKELANKNPVTPTTAENLSVEDIFDIICKLNNRTSDTSRLSEQEKNKTVGSFTFEGSASSLFYKFQSDFKMRLKDNGTSVSAIPMSEFREEPSDATIISIDNGLIDSLNIDQKGIKLRLRLNTNFDIFQWTHVMSMVNPKYNGYYYIISMRYIGHLRGNEWFVELDTQRYIPKKG